MQKKLRGRRWAMLGFGTTWQGTFRHGQLWGGRSVVPGSWVVHGNHGSSHALRLLMVAPCCVAAAASRPGVLAGGAHHPLFRGQPLRRPRRPLGFVVIQRVVLGLREEKWAAAGLNIQSSRPVAAAGHSWGMPQARWRQRRWPLGGSGWRPPLYQGRLGPRCCRLQLLVFAASYKVHGGRSGSPCRQPHSRPQRTSFCISSRDPGAA